MGLTNPNDSSTRRTVAVNAYDQILIAISKKERETAKRLIKEHPYALH